MKKILLRAVIDNDGWVNLCDKHGSQLWYVTDKAKKILFAVVEDESKQKSHPPQSQSDIQAELTICKQLLQEARHYVAFAKAFGDPHDLLERMKPYTTEFPIPNPPEPKGPK